MIEIRDDRFYYGFWFASIGPAYDWLCIVWREDDRVIGSFRHRYGGGTELGATLAGSDDLDDRRSWYRFSGPVKPNSEVCADIDQVMELIIVAARGGGFIPPDVQWRRTAEHVCAMGDVFQKRFAAASFVHTKPIAPAEREQLEREIAGTRPS